MKKHLTGILLLGLLSPLTQARADMQDVIYLENGSIIRGLIVENRPQEGVYKIQTSDGNVFVYRQNEITKITKEAAVGTTTPGGVVVNINNNNNNNNQSSATAAPAEPSDTPKSHNLGIGSYSVSLKDKGSPQPEEDKITFSGATLSYQYALNNHLMVRGNLYRASTSLAGYSPYFGTVVADISLTGAEALAYLSSNTQEKGWKFYAGAGFFKETMTTKVTSGIGSASDSKSHSGAEMLFGMGYNWNEVALDLAVAMRSASDYPEFNQVAQDLSVSAGSLSVMYRY